MTSATSNYWTTRLLDWLLRVALWLSWMLIIFGGALGIVLIADGVSGGGLELFRKLRVEIPAGDLQIIWLGTVSALILGVLSLVIITMLIRICRTLRAGDPFVPENARRIRIIAGAVAIMAVLSLVLRLVAQALIMLLGDKLNGALRPHFDLNLAAFAAVLILLVLAQIFDEGARLRAEEKMTI